MKKIKKKLMPVVMSLCLLFAGLGATAYTVSLLEPVTVEAATGFSKNSTVSGLKGSGSCKKSGSWYGYDVRLSWNRTSGATGYQVKWNDAILQTGSARSFSTSIGSPYRTYWQTFKVRPYCRNANGSVTYGKWNTVTVWTP